MVISTGMTVPRMDSVAALYALTNSMMLTPCGPRAVPTGGAGVADAAFKATLTRAATFFLGGILVGSFFGAATGGCPQHGQDGSSVTRSMGGVVCQSHLLDLREGQIDWGLAAEDLHESLQSLAVDVDLGDRRVDTCERAVDHHDRIAHREVGDLDLLAPTGGALAGRCRCRQDRRSEHLLDLVVAQRHGLIG